MKHRQTQIHQILKSVQHGHGKRFTILTIIYISFEIYHIFIYFKCSKMKYKIGANAVKLCQKHPCITFLSTLLSGTIKVLTKHTAMRFTCYSKLSRQSGQKNQTNRWLDSDSKPQGVTKNLYRENGCHHNTHISSSYIEKILTCVKISSSSVHSVPL